MKKAKSDDELSKCYGKQNLKRGANGKFLNLCGYSCRLKQACISASREDIEHVESQLTNISFEDAVMSREVEDQYDGDGAPVDSEEDHTELLDSFLPLDFGDEDEQRNSFDVLLKRFEVRADLRPFAIDFIRRFSHFYFHCKDTCDVLMRKIYKGENQAEIARQRGITRQAINSRVMKEFAGITRADIPKIPEELEGLECVVYMLCFVDGCSTRSAAIQTKKSHMTIQRMLQIIASKIGENVTVKKIKRKKIKKKRRTKKQIERDRRKQLEREASLWREFQKHQRKMKG